MATRKPKKPAVIPSFVVEYFLLGKTGKDALQRFTQDGGVVSDVWLAFAEDRTRKLRVLVAPSKNSDTATVANALHDSIMTYRLKAGGEQAKAALPNVSPLENYVGATISFEELLRIVLPMTTWWHRKQLSALQRKAMTSAGTLDQMLYDAICWKLGANTDISKTRRGVGEAPNKRVLEAVSVAALIGVFRAAEESPSFLKDVATIDPRTSEGEKKFTAWVVKNTERIATSARKELSRQLESGLAPLNQGLVQPMFAQRQLVPRQPAKPEEAPELIQRVFRDREGSLADTDALASIKADAAGRVFDVSCKSITWAMVDSGIARLHPAFNDRDDGTSRVRAAFDFTRIEMIRSMDLTTQGNAQDAVIDKVIAELESRRAPDPAFRPMAKVTLKAIGDQLRQKLLPDWGLIEKLVSLPNDDGSRLVSDHGTHVAGILGGDWRDKNDPTKTELRGVCPDINLYDLRVLHETNRTSTEFALLAALEFVQFLNARAGGNGPIVHGVNISMSIPYDVGAHGCGATPVCVACDRVSESGVVMVVAAGNRGWNAQELQFGNNVFCSITDPGNAREVITVGSTHNAKPHTYGVSYFSSRGPTSDGRIKPDIVAPGEQIRGPVRGDAADELDGTSMAAPFVSGAAAMLLARHRELIGDAERVKKILCDSATDLGREKYFQGAGLVDVLRALQSV